MPLERIVEELRRRGDWSGELRHRTRDGRELVVLSRLQLVHKPHGKDLVLELNRDVTERVGMEASLRESEERLRLGAAEREKLLEALREADRRKDEFLAVLSHELRNPLAPIRNSTFVLGRLIRADERSGKALATIDRQVDQLSRLVDDLLDVTRISRGKVRLQPVRLDLVELVRRAVEDHRSSFEAGGVGLAAVLDAGPVWVDGDPARLAQIAGNLLHNACKFTPRGGEVTVRVARDGGEGALLEVVDTGVGLDGVTLARLFQPFAQADRSLDRSQGGLGLGLALVKGLAELHLGEVRAESDGPGRGARFTVRIPAAPAPALVPQELGATAAAARGTGRTVVVIEDNRDAAESLVEVLDLEGHRVHVAFNGRDGLGAIREVRPEIVLCDLGLPDLDGYEVARAVRRDGDVSWTYLIALTGYAQPEDRRRAKEAGFDRHLAKPPDLDELERLIAEAPPRPAGDAGTTVPRA